MKKIRTTLGADGYCPEHNKLLYFTRKRARAAARRNHPDGHLQAYRCNGNKDRWHYGGPALAVLYGYMTNDEVYGSNVA